MSDDTRKKVLFRKTSLFSFNFIIYLVTLSLDGIIVFLASSCIVCIFLLSRISAKAEI